jgi:hypothetical protein
MGAMDKMKEMKDKATEKAKESMAGGKGDPAVDKAKDQIDEKTGNKYDEQVDKGAEMAKEKMRDAGSE